MIFRKIHDDRVFSPISGKFMTLEEVKDDAFSSGVMGPGFGIYPQSASVMSPFDGKVVMVFPTGHAIGLRRKDGLEVLIHIGIDTVNLQGKGFDILISMDENVRKGQKLVDFDKELLAEMKLDPTVIFVFTNWEEYDIEINNQAFISNKDVIAYAKKKVHHFSHH